MVYSGSLSGRYVMHAETELEMVERHVRQGERHVARQREILAELGRGGHSTAFARDLLVLFEWTQLQHRIHLDKLFCDFTRLEP
jgi:hypothetical protein